MSRGEHSFIKRKFFIISSIIILILLIFTITFKISRQKNVSEKTNAYNNLNLVEGVKNRSGILNITIDPRIELLTALQQQADYDLLTNFNFTYKDEMNKYFKKYKNHKAVKIFRNLSEKSFNYDAPPSAILYFSNTLKLKDNSIIPNALIARAAGKNKLLEFIDELRNFALESDFNNFYNQNIPFYQAMIDNVYNKVKEMGLIEALDDYYGMEVNSYNLILAPMLHAGGYGPKVEAKNGLYDVYGIIGPQGIIEDSDGKIVPDYSSETIQHIVWHEFSHSFINPLTEKHINEINTYNDLFLKIEKQMNAQTYPNWETCVNEHIIRAITARLIYLHQGQSAYDAIIASEKANGFYYVPALCESLTHYESNRENYPTLESYYPELIKVFKELSEQELGDEFFQIDFLGPINAIFNTYDPRNVVIITPSQEENIKIQEGILSYAKIVKDKIFPKAELIKDTEAVKRNLGDCIVLAYGTMEGNAWLREYKDLFPFKVENDKIIADKTYEGTGMVMISAMPNPQNYKNPLVIYTAQDAKDIIGINNVFHGPTDYIVAKDEQELHSGFYDKDKVTWNFQE